MSDNLFEGRVRAAAIAGWWTLLIAIAFLTIVWIQYLLVVSTRPAWVLAWFGMGLTWPFIQTVWIWMLAALKLCFWLMAIVVIWLTLWSRRLRKQAGVQ